MTHAQSKDYIVDGIISLTEELIFKKKKKTTEEARSAVPVLLLSLLILFFFYDLYPAVMLFRFQTSSLYLRLLSRAAYVLTQRRAGRRIPTKALFAAYPQICPSALYSGLTHIRLHSSGIQMLRLVSAFYHTIMVNLSLSVYHIFRRCYNRHPDFYFV